MKKYIFLIIILAFAFTTINAQSYKIIVNNSNNVSSITKAELANFLLKKAKVWSNGKEVFPLDLNPKSATREQLTKEILGKSIAQVLAFWQQSVFAGKATPPVELDSDNKMIEFVKNTPGAIGYVSANTNTDGVKTVPLN